MIKEYQKTNMKLTAIQRDIAYLRAEILINKKMLSAILSDPQKEISIDRQRNGIIDDLLKELEKESGLHDSAASVSG